MNKIPTSLGPHIRRLGFAGSGQTFGRLEDDTVCVINIQLSRARNVFYINLGAQPTFIPALGGAEGTTLKEYQCVMRTRVGKDWPLELDDEGLQAAVSAVDEKQRGFFGRARTLRQSLATDSPEELLRKFCAGTTRAAATLHLAEAAAALGHGASALAMVAHGLEHAPEVVHANLERVRAAVAARHANG